MLGEVLEYSVHTSYHSGIMIVTLLFCRLGLVDRSRCLLVFELTSCEANANGVV